MDSASSGDEAPAFAEELRHAETAGFRAGAAAGRKGELGAAFGDLAQVSPAFQLGFDCGFRVGSLCLSRSPFGVNAGAIGDADDAGADSSVVGQMADRAEESLSALVRSSSGSGEFVGPSPDWRKGLSGLVEGAADVRAHVGGWALPVQPAELVETAGRLQGLLLVAPDRRWPTELVAELRSLRVDVERACPGMWDMFDALDASKRGGFALPKAGDDLEAFLLGPHGVPADAVDGDVSDHDIQDGHEVEVDGAASSPQVRRRQRIQAAERGARVSAQLLETFESFARMQVQTIKDSCVTVDSASRHLSAILARLEVFSKLFVPHKLSGASFVLSSLLWDVVPCSVRLLLAVSVLEIRSSRAADNNVGRLCRSLVLDALCNLALSDAKEFHMCLCEELRREGVFERPFLDDSDEIARNAIAAHCLQHGVLHCLVVSVFAVKPNLQPIFLETTMQHVLLTSNESSILAAGLAPANQFITRKDTIEQLSQASSQTHAGPDRNVSLVHGSVDELEYEAFFSKRQECLVVLGLQVLERLAFEIFRRYDIKTPPPANFVWQVARFCSYVCFGGAKAPLVESTSVDVLREHVNTDNPMLSPRVQNHLQYADLVQPLARTLGLMFCNAESEAPAISWVQTMLTPRSHGEDLAPPLFQVGIGVIFWVWLDEMHGPTSASFQNSPIPRVWTPAHKLQIGLPLVLSMVRFPRCSRAAFGLLSALLTSVPDASIAIRCVQDDEGECENPGSCIENSFAYKFIQSFLQSIVRTARGPLRNVAFILLTRFLAKFAMGENSPRHPLLRIDVMCAVISACSSSFSNICGLLIQVVKNDLLKSDSYSELWRRSGRIVPLLIDLLRSQGTGHRTAPALLSALDVIMPAFSLLRALLLDQRLHVRDDLWIDLRSIETLRSAVSDVRTNLLEQLHKLQDQRSSGSVPASMTAAEWQTARSNAALQLDLAVDTCERIYELFEGASPLTGAPPAEDSPQ